MTERHDGSVAVGGGKQEGYGAPFHGLSKRWFARFEFKKEDAWIGVFWKRDEHRLSLDVWVCVLPMVPFHFGYQPQVAHG